ncbi:MAG: hypothetical protein ACRD1T_27165, partial [Acidimicrobiia bacterium]
MSKLRLKATAGYNFPPFSSLFGRARSPGPRSIAIVLYVNRGELQNQLRYTSLPKNVLEELGYCVVEGGHLLDHAAVTGLE